MKISLFRTVYIFSFTSPQFHGKILLLFFLVIHVTSCINQVIAQVFRFRKTIKNKHKMRLLFRFSLVIVIFLFLEIIESTERSKESSRNYDTSAEASNPYSYYSTYQGHPLYGSQSTPFSEQFHPSDYSPYYGQTDSKKRPNILPSTYGPYSPIECQEQMMNGAIADALQTSGLGNFGVLRPLAASMSTAVLSKIPLILAIKAVLLKLIVAPLALIFFSLPIVLPILFLFAPLWTRLRDTFSGTTTPAPAPVMVMMTSNGTNVTPTKARTLDYGTDIFLAILQSDQCFERMACSLGSRDANTPFIKPISWLLKLLENMKFIGNNSEMKSILKRYREAYMRGVAISIKNYEENDSILTGDACSEKMYSCNTPNLYLRPELVRYSRYL